jgi:hypothetical protein
MQMPKNIFTYYPFSSVLIGLISLIFTFFLSSCGIYSFTGTSIAPDIKTVSIRNYTNDSGMGPANLSQNFTEKLKEYFLENSNLKLVKSDGDIQLEGVITGYTLGPVGAQQGTGQFQTGQQNRLTIKVKTKFTNTKDETLNYEKEFSFYNDYTLSQTLNTVETTIVGTVTDQIVLDIFNASVANW